MISTRSFCGTTSEDDPVDVKLVDLRVAKDLLKGLETRVEEILAELLRVESSTGKGCIEVNAFKESVELDRHMCSVTNILPFPFLVLYLPHHRAG